MLTDYTKPDWSKLGQTDWAQAMQACAQEPAFHAEGDVWTHTRMVVAALQALPEYSGLSGHEQNIILHAALLHDVAKPLCTIVEDGKISSPRHAKVGEKVARELLWDVDFTVREQICALVRLHGLPLWGLEKPNPLRTAFLAHMRIHNAWTYLLAKADVLGRICDTQAELLYRADLYQTLCMEHACFDTPLPAYNGHSVFRYFWSDETYPTEIFDATTFDVIILSGIAGSGKDTYYTQHYAQWPLVSLDQIRQTLKVKPTDRHAQGKVAQMAYERAKEYCRRKQSFVWNSTNLTSDMRARLINTLRVYNPRFTIVYLETSLEKMFQRRRADIKASVLTRMMQQVDIPTIGEAHQIVYVRT